MQRSAGLPAHPAGVHQAARLPRPLQQARQCRLRSHRREQPLRHAHHGDVSRLRGGIRRWQGAAARHLALGRAGQDRPTLSSGSRCGCCLVMGVRQDREMPTAPAASPAAARAWKRASCSWNASSGSRSKHPGAMLRISSTACTHIPAACRPHTVRMCAQYRHPTGNMPRACGMQAQSRGMTTTSGGLSSKDGDFGPRVQRPAWKPSGFCACMAGSARLVKLAGLDAALHAAHKLVARIGLKVGSAWASAAAAALAEQRQLSPGGPPLLLLLLLRLRAPLPAATWATSWVLSACIWATACNGHGRHLLQGSCGGNMPRGTAMFLYRCETSQRKGRCWRTAEHAPDAKPLAAWPLQAAAAPPGGEKGRMLLLQRPRHLGTFLGGLLEGWRSNPAVTSCLPPA